MSKLNNKPVVVYGASGYTGRLVCEFLRQYGLPFIAAGRDAKRVQEVMDKVPGIETNTGPLGHGLPIAVGMAKAAQLNRERWKTFVITGDGEMQEGSNWEAIMAAAQFKLDNLTLIIDHNRQHIGWRAVRAQQNQVIQRVVFPADGPLNLILDQCLAGSRCLYAHHKRRVGMCVDRCISPRRLKECGTALCLGCLAKCGNLVLSGKTLIGRAPFQHLQRHIRMPRAIGKLAGRTAIVIQAKPFKTVENDLLGIVRIACAVRIFHAQQKFAPVMPGEEPVEQTRPRIANMHISSGRRRESCDDRGHIYLLETM